MTLHLSGFLPLLLCYYFGQVKTHCFEEPEMVLQPLGLSLDSKVWELLSVLVELVEAEVEAGLEPCSLFQ